jgi:glutamate formiminotransferase
MGVDRGVPVGSCTAVQRVHTPANRILVPFTSAAETSRLRIDREQLLPSLIAMQQSAITKSIMKNIIACNVYVSAGAPHYADLLTNLLANSQEHCRQIKAEARSMGTTPLENEVVSEFNIAVVHAFADGPYDRSSFHLAGTPFLVTDAASTLVSQAVEAIEKQKASEHDSSTTSTPHPRVGLVDHVSILPLYEINEKADLSEPMTGWIAKSIGETMEGMGVDVLYYGYAHPNRTPLATVRREKTTFFQTNQSSNNVHLADRGQATVGAPEHFTENFNIRLKPGTSKSMAQSLTKHVRERDGTGLPFVEALTLPYGKDQFEVACNLLNPTKTSTWDILDRVQSWKHADQIERSYRVGTTAQMCIQALERTDTQQGEQAYNAQVMEQFQKHLNQMSRMDL